MSRSVITCMSPGCANQIAYDPDKDTFVRLYCPTHYKVMGRHAAVRVLKPEKIPEPQEVIVPPPEVIVVMRCPGCKLRREVSERVWKGDSPVVCECGKSMIYHRTLGDEHVDGGKR